MLKYRIYYYESTTQQLEKCDETIAGEYSTYEEAMAKAVTLVGVHPLYNQIVVIEFYEFGDEVISSNLMEIIELSDEEDE